MKMKRILKITPIILLLVLMLLMGLAASAQGDDKKAQHNPKIDGALEQLLRMIQANPAAAYQFARQLGAPVEGNMIPIVLEPISQFKVEIVSQIVTIRFSLTIATKSKSLIKLKVPLAALLILPQLASLVDISYIRLPYVPQTLAISEGVALTGASTYHQNGFRGQGVKIAVIDLGFAGLSAAQARGELPRNIRTKDFTGTGLETGTSHGTAVAEIIYDMAPEAELYLMKIGDEVDLENAKDEAISQGIKIINHSVGWFNTNFYDGTGIIADIASSAKAAGILWINAAGNYAQRHYKGLFSDSNRDSWHEFSGSDESINIVANGGELIQVYLTWNDWPAARNDYDLYLFDNYGNQVAVSDKLQTGTEEPTESISYRTPTSGTYHLKVKVYSAAAAKELALFSLNHDIEHAVAQGSIITPADSANVMAVAAINKGSWTTGPQAAYSSQGPTGDGRPKPDISGPDKVTTSTFGEFRGTSAAASHVAGAAALLLSENPGLSADQLQAKLKQNAINMGSGLKFGAGRLNMSVQVVRQPDLVIASADYSPRNPRVGDAVNFAVTVRNQGNGNAGPFIVEIRDLAGNERRSLSGLAAGEGANISFSRRLNATSEIFTITVDPLNQISESNEGNNSMQVRVEAQAELRRPDLIIERADYSPTSPRVGDTISFTAVIKNQGNGDAGPFSVEIRGSSGSDRRSLAGLAAGASTSISFSLRLGTRDETFTITVDPLNQVAESDESNNTRQIRITGESLPSLSIDVWTDKEAYQIGERLTIHFRINQRAYVYIYDIDPAGNVALIFPNRFSSNNLLEAGTYTLPDRGYILTIRGPEGTEYIHAIASLQPFDLRLDGMRNPAFLSPSAFRSELERRIQSIVPGAQWAWDVASFRVGAAPPPNRTPVASFSFSPTEPFVGDSVTFDASSSYDPDGFITNYQWDFTGDGLPEASGLRVTYTFTASGSYQVSLTVTDNGGLSNSVSRRIQVLERSQPPPPSGRPTASITVDRGCGPTGRPYRIGDIIIVSYTVSEPATAILYDFAPMTPTSGILQTKNLGSLPGGRTQSFTGRVVGAPGVETLVLQAVTSSGRVVTAACSFSIEGVNPTLAQITVNKGCDSVYNIGEPISISYNVAVDVIRIRIYNIVPGGIVELTPTPLTSRSGTLTGLPLVGPNPGDRMLILVAVTNSGLLTATCRYTTP